MNNLSKKLNPEQLSAVVEKDGYILVLAGAGSGKTRVLTERIAHLVGEGVSPYNILAITFTNKAAAEMQLRISNVLSGDSRVWTSTFHSFCARILRVEAEWLGYNKNFSIYTEVESERVVKRILKTLPSIDPKQLNTFMWHISRAKNAAMDANEYYQEIKNEFVDADDIRTIYANYEKELKASNALDFDDLLWKAVVLFENFPEVLKKYQTRFEYINVDEFQDTNMLQFKLVKLLSDLHHNLFVVGDEDQSIYSWRGALISNILEFPDVFKDAKVFKLEQNYRSTPEILKTANNVIGHNRERNAKKLWTSEGSGNSVTYFEAYNEREEADFVARNIARFVSMGEKYSDFAILVRANSLTRIFEENFNLYGIPYKMFGGFKFFERKEIKDLLAYIRLAVNPKDNESFLRAISYPKRGLGDVALSQLEELTNDGAVDLYTALSSVSNSLLSSTTKSKYLLFKDCIDKMIEQKSKLAPQEFVMEVLEISGLRNVLSSGNDDDKNRLENMEELVTAVAGFEKDNPQSTIDDFLQSVALVSDSDDMNDDNYVTIATVHAVKGLEFENVFVIGLEDGIFPTKRALDSGEIEEERRLVYVAITRARKKLFVTWARSRFRFNAVESYPRSRFIDEMKGERTKSGIRSEYSESDQIYDMKFGEGRINFASKSERMSAQMAKNTAKNTKKVQNYDFDAFEKDTIVEHNKFGRGMIISTSGEGEDKICAIAFQGLGVKKFALAIAIKSLTIVDENE
ncbi:MAG TPA: UvrD-helicase domain-containing protein [Clostridia bacterium]|nr:UvrD-helicase domain-containing protein [Clostridia bacterium]